MGRLIKVSSRIAATGIMLAGVSVLSQGLFSRTAHADDQDCTKLPGFVLVSGSSAVQPTVAAFAQSLVAGGTSVVYSKQGSCTGVAAILGAPPTTSGSASYWDAGTTTATPKTCTLPASTPVDLGVSDVFASSCPTVKDTALATASVADFDTFFAQVMEFVVPAGSDQVSISAEAAYLTFGFGASGATPWSTPAQFLVRNNTSGTQVMLSKAIGLDASKWIGYDESSQGGAGQIFKDIKAVVIPDPAFPADNTKRSPGDAKKMIGIVSSGEADADVDNVKRLAYQGYGQTCAFWADSGVKKLDKAYVRDGHYPVWGPLHVLAKVAADGVTPTSAGAKTVIDLLTAQSQSTVDIEIAAHVVPLCAMNVSRSSELGPLSSVQRTNSCGCYFDTKTGGDVTGCTACTAENAATKCTGDRPVCNYGFCEVK